MATNIDFLGSQEFTHLIFHALVLEKNGRKNSRLQKDDEAVEKYFGIHRLEEMDVLQHVMNPKSMFGWYFQSLQSG